jgi:fluoroacetyl-CoA thioesterase
MPLSNSPESMMSLKVRTAEASVRLSIPETTEASRMLELMQLAAARLMKSHLRAGESSIAIEMNLTFRAPTTMGGAMRAVAAYEGISGRMHRFTINTFDESGLIGSAKHTRAVVGERRLLAVARRRAGRPSMLFNV